MSGGSDDGLFPEETLQRVPAPDPVEAPVDKRFAPFNPHAVMLLPPSLDEWLPDNHLARFIADLVDTELDLTGFYDSYTRSKGRPPYDPRMMLRVMLYGYCTGVRSSRKLETACIDSVAFRWLAAGAGPDFRAFSRFRARHLQALAGVFVQALALCREAGMVKLGTVALDGTKVQANASRRKAMSYQRLVPAEEKLAEQVEQMLNDAATTDEVEDQRYGVDARGDELPEELVSRSARLATLRRARQQLEQDAADKARQVAETKARDRGDDDDTVADKGQAAADTAVVKPSAQRNFTDPDARIMKLSSGGFDYCYNAQTVVDAEHQVIVATELSNTATDVGATVPMVLATAEQLGVWPARWLMDAGYCSKKNLTEVAGLEDTHDTEFFIATGRVKHGEKIPDAPRGRIPNDATLRERMGRRLRTKRGKAVYGKRKSVIEPVFGQIATRQGKHVVLRGLAAARAEWDLVAGCHNLLKLFSFRQTA
ncbi:transposase, IS4 family [Corynebacterium efficiens YS-314]|uniref:Transposase n=1 Tax=Corynebacterium efficiens (strain DSM 44549 / YS-314 / AJ 12310 / JCM 11189 / NBRC 100395) TaxID=196164 RepID=Q8CMH4_COREF|nr:IS1182-like element ISCef1 family transposase [Corynebacterium efficiens]EEW48365.1 transposase, IS4 family [Corynebacterium efficiens YS-314]BAC17105.1 hypothetical protein [Corynebacterium efficiens YS-314]BAC17201.1 conserved hypothetical protein [Corynebacterium efficiens YS-314]BAC18390.1 conserved hypothetical protein [Corynebacterium efficiens YS-314]BAC19100.1 conserved hypothetical protein [Corynebacterium efficiens YS-314]